MLAKLADLKARLNIASGDTSQDSLLTGLVTGVGALIERYCGRGIEYTALVVETFDGGVFELQLGRLPIVGTPTVKISHNYDFAGAAALTLNVEFRPVAARGLLVRLPVGTRWPDGRDNIQVTYNAGYYDPATEPGPAGASPVPAHIQEAVLLQATDLYNRRSEPGYKVVWNVENISAGYAPAVELLPVVKELLRGERRIGI